MPLLQRIAKPATRRGKRFLEKREPKLEEDTKSSLFIRGSSASQTVITAMKDLCALKKPHAVFFNKKNECRPFEDITPVEGFLQKNDSALFMFGSHNKKRPHNLIIGRTYEGHLLDMVEMGVENFQSLSDFKVPKIPVGTKPILLFAGEPFETSHEYQRLKNLFIDFFHGPDVEEIRLVGLEHVLMFTAHEGKIYFRSYRTLFKKSGVSTPRIELEEMGPHMDFTLRRTKLASEDLFKLACKQPKLQKKKVKNVERNKLGTTLGRIHMKRLDFSKLQTRKMKGLKKSKEELKAIRKVKKTEETSKASE